MSMYAFMARLNATTKTGMPHCQPQTKQTIFHGDNVTSTSTIHSI